MKTNKYSLPLPYRRCSHGVLWFHAAITQLQTAILRIHRCSTKKFNNTDISSATASMFRWVLFLLIFFCHQPWNGENMWQFNKKNTAIEWHVPFFTFNCLCKFDCQSDAEEFNSTLEWIKFGKNRRPGLWRECRSGKLNFFINYWRASSDGTWWIICQHFPSKATLSCTLDGTGLTFES